MSLKRRVASAALLLGLCIGGWQPAVALPPAEGAVLLEVTGTIGATNGSTATGEPAAKLDLSLLERFGGTVLTTDTPWTEAPVTFEGMSGAQLLALLEVTGQSATAIALNDYRVEIPVSDFREAGLLIAYKRDGKSMPVRENGPLWIVFPYSQRADLNTNAYQARPGGLRHKGGLPALLALLVGAALGALAILFAHALNEINKEVGDPPDNLRWAVSDLEHEFLRLRLASERTAQSGSAADFQALKLRLDIFASRIPILQVGTFRRKLDERPDLAAILAQAEATLARADEVLLQAETLGRRQTAQALSQALEPLAPALRRMTVRVGQLESQQQADYQTEMQRLLVLIVLVFIVLAAGVLAFVVLLWLQHRRLSQSNASLSRLSHELFQANQTKSRFLANMSH
ncbi:unnamed protein product, partial [Symbiodinium necroappetens]